VLQELVDARRRVRLHADEHIGEIGDQIHAVDLARRDERVEAAGFSPASSVPTNMNFLRPGAATRRARSEALCRPADHATQQREASAGVSESRSRRGIIQAFSEG